MSDERERQLREVQSFFRLPSIGLVEKDLEVVRAIAAITALDTSPFTLVFGGGTALARAHKIVRRMSEDVDFKIVPKVAAPVTRSGLRRSLGKLRSQVRDALHGAGFVFDPKDGHAQNSQNEDRYTVWHLPYACITGEGHGLRPEIKLELTYAPMRQPPVLLPVSSFVTEATKAPPDIKSIGCVGLNETAAEKLIALTRRTAMDLAGLTRGEADPTLVRHIYDLHMLRGHVDQATVVCLASKIAQNDAEEFRNQYPAYADDIAGETRKAMDELRGDATRQRYDAFMAAMVYGDTPEFASAMATVTDWTERFHRPAQNEER